MTKPAKTMVHDSDLTLDAYRFEGLAQPFPNHFHEDYVLGLVLRGERRLLCKGEERRIGPGHLLLLNPGDSHGCRQCDGGTLDYISLTLSRETMASLAGEITGAREAPGFSPNVLHDESAACALRSLHAAVMSGAGRLDKEERLLLLLSLLLKRCGFPSLQCAPARREQIERACALMARRYAERISLDQLCACAGLGRSALLRAFVKCKGVTPHSYLESVRIGEAKRMLERGVAPVDAALQTGFADQSHFTHAFQRLIGLTPGAYRDIFEANEKGGPRRA